MTTYDRLTLTIFGTVILAALVILGFRAAGASIPCSNARSYEVALGVSQGGYRVIPQLGFSIQYLGTEARGHGICAVLVRRAS